MGKRLFIAEKPSVAREFAKALKVDAANRNGYMESQDTIITWCVGHLVTMSYPEAYDAALKKWSLQTLPFIPDEFRYEVIPSAKNQYQIVSGLLNRADVEQIYVCTDSGREGEYIYRLVDQMAKVPDSKEKRRVWIDSQTEEEILRGIREAKPLAAYNNLSSAAYLRAKEDYLMGINFSRVLSLKYGQAVMNFRKSKNWSAISVGRVMTCVQGMVVRREREIRDFVKTPFYRVLGDFHIGEAHFDGEWRAVEDSKYYQSPYLYKENGFKKREHAEKLIAYLADQTDVTPLPETTCIEKIEKKKENKNPPLLFNLAELQNVCSKLFKISPDECLKIVQELYEKKLVTYPRTDARVLSTAVAKEIHKNISGLRNYSLVKDFAQEILDQGGYKNIAKTRYVNDKQITDHYAIVPTGQGLGALRGLNQLSERVYEVIVRRFLCIFYPPAQYQKISLVIASKTERFFASFKMMLSPGYLVAATASFARKSAVQPVSSGKEKEEDTQEEQTVDNSLIQAVSTLKKGMPIALAGLQMKEGETSPPKRYNSGSMILAMENAGQLIEDEELRAQIKGSGIGTSATRAEILNKLVRISYLHLNKKTQIITPTQLGEMVYDVVEASISSLLNPELTASWEKGLTYVAEGQITEQEYMDKLDGFVRRRVDGVKGLSNQGQLQRRFQASAEYYKN